TTTLSAPSFVLRASTGIATRSGGRHLLFAPTARVGCSTGKPHSEARRTGRVPRPKTCARCAHLRGRGRWCGECRVCENDLRKKQGRGHASRLYCRPPNGCKAEAARWPEKYEYGLPPTTSPTNVRNAYSISIKLPLAGDRPPHRCLREWS